MRLVLAIVAAVLVFAAPASAATLVVDDNRAECPAAGYASIQDAVDSAAPNDTIQLCGGFYGDATFADGKDNVTLTAEGAVGWARMFGRIRIDGAKDVRLTSLSIMCDDNPEAAITVDDRGRAIIRKSGVSMRTYGDWCLGIDASERAAVDVRDSYVLGARASGKGTRLTAIGNFFNGKNPPPDAAVLNGLDVRDGAQATVQGNTFSGFSTQTRPWFEFHWPGWVEAGGVIRVENTSGRKGNVQIVGNTISSNKVGANAVALRNARGVSVEGNVIAGNAGRGIFVDEDSRRNRIAGNRLFGNVSLDDEDGVPAAEYYDCRDASKGKRTAGTANRWVQNTSDAGDRRARPAGICRAP